MIFQVFTADVSDTIPNSVLYFFLSQSFFVSKSTKLKLTIRGPDVITIEAMFTIVTN